MLRLSEPVQLLYQSKQRSTSTRNPLHCRQKNAKPSDVVQVLPSFQSQLNPGPVRPVLSPRVQPVSSFCFCPACNVCCTAYNLQTLFIQPRCSSKRDAISHDESNDILYRRLTYLSPILLVSQTSSYCPADMIGSCDGFML